MTTVIVVAIVALVFFVTVSVITFMTWKRETEMRTDSLKGIENCLNEVLHELAGENDGTIGRQRFYSYRAESFSDGHHDWNRSRKRKDTDIRKTKNKKDPFSWVRAEDNENLKVFRPDETQTRQVKWTEVPVPETAEAPLEEGMEKVSENIETAPGVGDQLAEVFEQTLQEAPKKDEVSEDKHDIDLTFIDLEDIENIDLNEMDFGRMNFFESSDNVPADYNMGRSGRRYTAEELESLIKE